MSNIINIFKKNTVFSISLIAAIISAIFVAPNKGYLDYIDTRTIALLMCLMGVIAGFRSIGIFEYLSQLAVKKMKTTKTIYLISTLSCFFSSMLITNDVTLITFVPFTIAMLGSIGMQKIIIKCVVLETIAANLGSIITPIGNPQNLYLYTLSHMSMMNFMKLLLPYWSVSLGLLLLAILLGKNENVPIDIHTNITDTHISKKKSIIYILLFILCLLTVMRLVDHKVMLIMVMMILAITDIKVIKMIDYMLLLTFICFFIFVGNIKNIPAVSNQIRSLMIGRELITSVIASQFISNVPAAVLLSGFTSKYEDIAVGTDIGGLGTLIASLASLISYKFYALSKNSDTKKYLLIFTVYNLIGLVILTCLAFIIR